MIMDATGQFSNAQAITASAASTNLIDLGAGSRAGGTGNKGAGRGTPIPLTINVVEAFATLTSLAISVQTDDNAAFSSAKTVWTSPAYTLAELNLALTGDQTLLPDSLPISVEERYVRLYYTVGGSNATTGKITAGVVGARQNA